MANFVQLITIKTAYYPRMTQCRAKGDIDALPETYRFASRMVALVVFPLGFTLALFSHDILLDWLPNPEVAEQVHPILSLLVVGTSLLTGLMMPYAMTLAHADTRITLNSHAVLLCIQVPAVVYFAMEFGAIGAAGLWCALFCIYGPLYAWRVNKKYLPSSQIGWLWECVLRPAMPAFVSVVLVKQAVTLTGLQGSFVFLYLPLAWALSQLAAWLAAPLPGIRLRTLLHSA